MQSFDQYLEWVLEHEGGFVNHPDDPGGATNKGITQATYNAWLSYQGRATKDVRLITDSEVHAIYVDQYWLPIRGGDLPRGVDYAVFDFAVNSGVSRASRFLQSIVGVAQDGVIGAHSLAAAKCFAPEHIIVALCERRMAFLRRLRHFNTFGRGWTRRVMGEHEGFQTDDIGVIDRAVMMARKVEDIPPPKIPAPGKGFGRASIWRWLGGLLS